MRKRLVVFASAVLAMSHHAAAQAPADAIDVSAAKYAVGCATPFDATGVNNNLCEVRNAVADLKAATGYRQLYFPPGLIKIETSNLTAALQLTKRIGIEGAGQQRTGILLGNSKGAFLQIANPTDCNNMPGYCNVEVHDLTIVGNGLSTTGNVFDLYDVPYLHYWNMAIRQVNAFAINLVDDTERSYFEHISVDTSLGIRSVGDGNETYFDGVEVLNSGLADGNHCYDGPQCNADGSFRLTGTYYPNPHMAVSLDGVVGKLENSSIKSTAIMGGIQLPSEGGAMLGGYIESAVPGATNTAVVVGDGKMEISHITAAVGVTDTVISVDDARWQKPYVTDPALAKTIQVGGARNLACIYPADYDPTQSGPSTIVPGVARNYCEPLSVAAFAGDGKLYLQGTRVGRAWPVGSKIEMRPHGVYGTALLEGVHVNSVQPYPWSTTVLDGCSDTALLTTWTSNPSQVCAEIIVGAVPDGLAVPFMHQHYATVSGALHLIDDTFYTSTLATSEQDGEGWIKIPAGGSVTIDQGNGPLHGTPGMYSYSNSNTQVAILKDPQGGTALAQVNDATARYFSDTSNMIFDAWTVPGYSQPMQHWTLNATTATPSVVAH